MRIRGFTSSVIVALACFSGCSGSSKSDDGAKSTRSPTCLKWQDAVCDYLADQCHALTRADCDDLYQATYCKDDATMQKCMNAIGTASCPDTPAECTGVVDTEPAIAWCQDFLDAYCAAAETCKLSSKSECLSASAGKLNCANAVGIGPTADQCMTDLGATPCNQLTALPASCKGVIKLVK
jgi:hypothetical protein